MANAIPLWTKTYWSVSSLTISCWPHMESIGSTIPLCLDCVWKLPGTQTASVTRPSAPRRRGPRGARGTSDARSVVFIELYEGYTMRYVISTRMRSDVEHIYRMVVEHVRGVSVTQISTKWRVVNGEWVCVGSFCPGCVWVVFGIGMSDRYR